MGTFKNINTIDDLRKLCPGLELSADAKPVKRGKPPAPLLHPWCGVGRNGQLIIQVGLVTAPELNHRVWQAKNRRAGAAWQAVRKAIGIRLDYLKPFAEHYQDGGALKIVFTRCSSRQVDRCNLSGCTKGVEDAVAYLLGANDGDKRRWFPDWAEEKSLEVGVRVEISVY